MSDLPSKQLNWNRWDKVDCDVVQKIVSDIRNDLARKIGVPREKLGTVRKSTFDEISNK